MEEQRSEIIQQTALLETEAMDKANGAEMKSNSGCDGGDQGGVPVIVVSGGGEVDSTKRKRGRQVKQEVEERDDRGRPKGSIGDQGVEVNSAWSNFTPHIINLQVGENIVQTLCSISQRTVESICILSACGTLSMAELRSPGPQGGTMRHEGLFQIISLSGLYSSVGQAVGRDNNNWVLSVHLMNGEGRSLGGIVDGPLIVADPTMVVIATFRDESMTRRRLELLKLVPLRAVDGMLPDEEVSSIATVPQVEEAEKVIDDSGVIVSPPPGQTRVDS